MVLVGCKHQSASSQLLMYLLTVHEYLTSCVTFFLCRIGVELLGDFLGIYYAIQVFAEMSVIGALLYTSFK